MPEDFLISPNEVVGNVLDRHLLAENLILDDDQPDPDFRYHADPAGELPRCRGNTITIAKIVWRGR